MSDIIDNQQAAVNIKALLKNKNITQQKLADYLNIPLSAVSKCLNGKSSFDSQQLEKISKLFNVSIETLIFKKTEKDDKIITEFERSAKLKKSGIEALIDSNADIKKTDLYFKYLVEYIIEEGDKESFDLLKEKNLLLFDFSDRYFEVMVKVIIYLIKNNDDVSIYLDDYINKQKSFEIIDKKAENEFFNLINSNGKFEIIDFLISKTVIRTKKFLKFVNIKVKMQAFTINNLIEIISIYKLDKLFDKYYNNFTRIKPALFSFLKYNYQYGIDNLIKNIAATDKQEIFIVDREFYLKAVEFKNISALKQFLEISDKFCNEYLAECLKCGFIEGMNFIFEKYKENLNLKNISYLAAKYSRFDFYKKIEDLSLRDYDIALSLTSVNDMEFNKFLLTKGAQFKDEFYSKDICDKSNNLIKNLRGNKQ